MLMPAFVLSVAMIGIIRWDTLILFAILHLMVYPASNGYNSYFDRDTTAIGGLKTPPPVHRSLVWAVQGLDLGALILTGFWFPRLLPGILAYQIASRLYSYHRIRIKALPWLSLVMVGAFQGILIYGMVAVVSQRVGMLDYRHAGVIFCYLLASYPITQIYQVEEDLLRGDRTVAARLGQAGTLLYTAVLFGLYIGLAWRGRVPEFPALLLCAVPVLVAFASVTVRYLRSHSIQYESVRLLTLLNWLSSLAYFGYCLWSGSIALTF